MSWKNIILILSRSIWRRWCFRNTLKSLTTVKLQSKKILITFIRESVSFNQSNNFDLYFHFGTWHVISNAIGSSTNLQYAYDHAHTRPWGYELVYGKSKKITVCSIKANKYLYEDPILSLFLQKKILPEMPIWTILCQFQDFFS